MHRDAIIATLQSRQAELKALGAVSLSLFGSAARGEASDSSDIDLAVTFDLATMPHGFYYIGRLEELRERLEAVLGQPSISFPNLWKSSASSKKLTGTACVPSKSPARRLRDIVENAAFIASYIDGLDEEAFRADRMRRDAVERCLQRISEAAVKLGSDAETLLPSQPWKQIRGLGNVLRHGYDIVGAGEIWIMASEQAAAACQRLRECAQCIRNHAAGILGV